MGETGTLRGWPLQTGVTAQVLKEEPHRCKFELHDGPSASRGERAYERGDMTVVEVNRWRSAFPSRPSGKGSSNGSLLAKRAFGVTGLAKVLKEWFDLIVEQGLRPCPEPVVDM